VIVAGVGRAVRVWELDGGRSVGEPLRCHESGPVWSVAVGKVGGRPVIVAGFGSAMWVWELDGGRPVDEPLCVEGGPVCSLAVGELGGRSVIVFGCDNGAVRVWELEWGRPVGDSLEAHEDHRRVVWSRQDGNRVWQMWELEWCRPEVKPLLVGERNVCSVAVGELGGRPVIVAGGEDGTVWVCWTRGQRERTISVHAPVHSVALAPDARIVVAASRGLMVLKLHPMAYSLWLARTME